MEPLEAHRDVWVYARQEDGALTRPTLELLAAGRKVADKLDQRLVAVLLGHRLESLDREAIAYGADRVLVVEDPRLEHYLCLPYTTALTQLARKRKPNVFLFVADEVGRDLTPRVAYRLKTGLATDNIDLEVEDYFHPMTRKTFRNLLIQIRPDFATRVAKIFTPMHRPQVATVRPGNFPPLARDTKRKGIVERVEPQFQEGDFAVELMSVRQLPRSNVNLDEAKAVVSIGLGILRDGQGRPRSPLEGYELAQQLVAAIRDRFGIHAELGASRALLYAELKELEGLITKERQVGQTGKTVSPDYYFALGISGAVQHRVGMLRSKRVVAVNLDPAAPIFQVAHYPIVGDLYEAVPRLVELIRHP